MLTVPEPLRQRLRQYDQEHVLAFWDRLDDAQRQELVRQLEGLDLEQLQQLAQVSGVGYAPPPPDRIAPVPVIPADAPDHAEKRHLGAQAIQSGELAILLVAGGQGSRLGFEHPKGMYPVGPVSRKPLFQVHAEKVLALGRRYGVELPMLIMTSPATHDETIDFFRQHDSFGLNADEVFFFCQGTMPALDLKTGRLLLESPGRLFLSPDGHGGTLTALAGSGLLGRMKQRSVRHIFYFQVDNPLVRIGDPVFLGHHLAVRAEASSKVVAKLGPEERMGVFACIDGRCAIVEYSDLPKDLMYATDEHGRLLLWAGNPAIHLFDLAFLERMTAGQGGMPFHIARKKVPYIDAAGQKVDPPRENALKFERFIFDVLPAAERWTVVESMRASEFAPLKNATGPDSPETVEQALSDQAAAWIEHAGGRVPRRADGSAAVALEVSPLFALDADEFADKCPPGLRVDGPRYFS